MRTILRRALTAFGAVTVTAFAAVFAVAFLRDRKRQQDKRAYGNYEAGGP